MNLLNSCFIFYKIRFFSFPGVQFLQGKHLVQHYILLQNNKRNLNNTLWEDYNYDLSEIVILRDSLIKKAIDSF